MLPPPLNSEMEVMRNRSFERKATLLNNYIHNLCIFKVRVYRIIDGSLKHNTSVDGKALLSNITEYHWIYESKHDKMYGLGRVENTCVYFKIRICYRGESSMKIVIADTYDDLIKNVMSERIYKKYKKWMS
jgi:hypothetical protein